MRSSTSPGRESASSTGPTNSLLSPRQSRKRFGMSCTKIAARGRSMWNCGPLAKRGERKIAHASPTGELAYLAADGPMNHAALHLWEDGASIHPHSIPIARSIDLVNRTIANSSCSQEIEESRNETLRPKDRHQYETSAHFLGRKGREAADRRGGHDEGREQGFGISIQESDGNDASPRTG